MSLNETDNADGIAKTLVSKMFEPYASTKPQTGAGLGIYMSRIIVERHLGGALNAESLNGPTKLIIDM